MKKMKLDALTENEDEDEKSDIVQISTSAFAKKLMQSREFVDFFEGDMDKIKFAVCVAIREDLEPTPPDGTFVTSHNFANLDYDGRMSALLSKYRGSSTPARLTVQLAESGFRWIKAKMDLGDSLRDLI